MTTDELLDFYEENGVKIRRADGSYCKLYAEQVFSSGYNWDYENNVWVDNQL